MTMRMICFLLALSCASCVTQPPCMHFSDIAGYLEGDARNTRRMIADEVTDEGRDPKTWNAVADHVDVIARRFRDGVAP